MGFQPTYDRQCPPDGDLDSKIAIVGEAPGTYEIRERKPFVGPAGRVLEQCMHSAGLIRSECYITNLCKEQVRGGEELYNPRKDKLTAKGEAWAVDLHEELKECGANVIVSMGGSSTAALTGTGKIMKRRGYVHKYLHGERKVLPAIHPAAALRGQYIYRHYIAHDLTKAAAESKFRGFDWPTANVHVARTMAEIEGMCNLLDGISNFVCDIEVWNYEVSCVGFAEAGQDVEDAYVIPLYSTNPEPAWTEPEEIYIWQRISKILENPNTSKVFQNGIFDLLFLAQRNNILTKGYIDDSMIAHHIMYPDFLKGLEFLGSIYTRFPYWKDLVYFKGGGLKKEA